jgi:hypothetical protein
MVLALERQEPRSNGRYVNGGTTIGRHFSALSETDLRPLFGFEGCPQGKVMRSVSKGGDSERSIRWDLLDLLFLVVLRSEFGFCLALRSRVEECVKVRLRLQLAASKERKNLIR